ncbi:MAG TPA: SCP2 sterol-binding domain-containing protein [Actinomycetes bacterium]
MASIEACQSAVQHLAELLSGADDGVRTHADARTISCRLTDLDTTISGRLDGGQLLDISTERRPPAQLRLTMTSDDLMDLTEGRLSFPRAWASGRIKLDASLRDLLRLRSLL